MKKQISFAFLFACMLVIVPACEKTNTGSDINTMFLDQADCTGVDIASNSYSIAIKAILDTECASSGCHDAATKSDGIDLSTYGKAKTAFQNTNCLCAIHHGSGCKPMPNSGAKLSDAILKKIDCWAKNGYVE
jgi:hypothetical protein